MWQNPQIAIFSPVYPLTALMPLQLAMKINIVLHYWIGFIGMHVLLTRVIGVTFLPAVIYLATLVTASGAPAIHLRVGHSVFLPGFYLPLQIYFFFQALKTGSWKFISLSAATLALDGLQRRHAHPADVDRGPRHVLFVRRDRAARLAAAGHRSRLRRGGTRLLSAQAAAGRSIRRRRLLLGHAKSD